MIYVCVSIGLSSNITIFRSTDNGRIEEKFRGKKFQQLSNFSPTHTKFSLNFYELTLTFVHFTTTNIIFNLEIFETSKSFMKMTF